MSVMLDDLYTSILQTRTSKLTNITYCTSPALDDGAAAVGMEVTAAEGAPDDTGTAVDNAMSVMLDDLHTSINTAHTHAQAS